MTVSPVPRRRRRPAPSTDTASCADDAQALDAARQLALRLQGGVPDALAQFRASGLGGVAVPKAYGGGGVGSGTLAQLIRLLAAGDPALARIAHSHYAVLEVLRATGSEPQKQAFFRRALDGERFAAALAETGVDEVCRIETRIHCVDGHYRIDGRKCDAGGAAQADWVALSVRSGDGNLLLAFVPRGSAGLRVEADGGVAIDEAEVGPLAVIPYRVVFDTPGRVGPLAQLLHAAIDLGIADAALADSAAVLRHDHDAQRLARFGWLGACQAAAGALLDDAALQVDALTAVPGQTIHDAAALAVTAARVLCADLASQAGAAVFELAGRRLLADAARPDRHWRDARRHDAGRPARQQARVIGDHCLNGTPPPRHGAY